MARFKLVKIGKVNDKNIVRVQKVRFKIKLRTFMIALACAILVWLYVKGTALKAQQPPAENNSPETTTSEMQTKLPAEIDPEVSVSFHAAEGSLTHA